MSWSAMKNLTRNLSTWEVTTYCDSLSSVENYLRPVYECVYACSMGLARLISENIF